MASNQHGILRKDWQIALVLSILLGWLGFDRFYIGKVGTGILKLVTLGGWGIWWVIDILLIATKNIRGVEWVKK